MKEWLASIDLEEYHQKFLELGASKLHHLDDLDDSDLTEIGMKKLEMKRIKKALAERQQKTTEKDMASTEEKKTVQFPLPNTSFGHTRGKVAEEKLKTKFDVLYYQNPKNFKMAYTNTFILAMCASADATAEFSTQRALVDWARGERDDRFKCALAFADITSVDSETDYFKKQCAQYQAKEIKHEYRDVLNLSDVPPEKKRECCSTTVRWKRSTNPWTLFISLLKKN